MLTINNEQTITGMRNNNFNENASNKQLASFVAIAKQKDQDYTVLQDAANIIVPILQELYDKGLNIFDRAKETKDPLEQIDLYIQAQETLKKITTLKTESGFDFAKFEGVYSGLQTETKCSLAQGLLDDINLILGDANKIPTLYDAGYRYYQEALIATDPHEKKEKYETSRDIFEKIMESKKSTKSYSPKMNDIFIESKNKLQDINNFLLSKGSNIHIEKVDIASLPVYWGPSPFLRNGIESFHLYVGENKQQFDTVEIFDVTGKLVALYQNGKDIFLTPDTSSKYAENVISSETNPLQFEIPLNQKSLSAGVYIFRISSKTTKITKNEKFEVL